MVPVNRVAAAAVIGNRKTKVRIAKSRLIETKRVAPNGTQQVSLYSRGGAVGLGELGDRGGLQFLPLDRIKTQRERDKQGRYRWYNKYRLPSSHGGKTVTVRLDTTDDDRVRGFNRTENVRVIASTDPDFQGLFRRRNDIESINRGIDDSLYLGRARQWVNLLGYALMVNGLAVHRYRARTLDEQAA